jgi:hypothetical protein
VTDVVVDAEADELDDEPVPLVEVVFEWLEAIELELDDTGLVVDVEK